MREESLTLLHVFNFFSVFFSRPVLGMLLGALIWIATLVPYFVVFENKKYRALTRYIVS